MESGLHLGDSGSGSRPGLSALQAAAEAGGPAFDPAPMPSKAPAAGGPGSVNRPKPAAKSTPVRRASERPMSVPLLAGFIVALAAGFVCGLLKYTIPIPLVFGLAAGVAVGWTISVMAGSKTGKVKPALVVQCVTIGGFAGLLMWYVQYRAVIRNLGAYIAQMPPALEISDLDSRFVGLISFPRFLALRAARSLPIEVQSSLRSDEFEEVNQPLTDAVAGALSGAGIRINGIAVSIGTVTEDRSNPNPKAVRVYGNRAVFSGWVDDAAVRERAVKIARETPGITAVDARNLTDEIGAQCWDLTWGALLSYGGKDFKNFSKLPSFGTEFGGSANNLAQWTSDCLQDKIRGRWRFQAGPLEPSGPFFYAVFFMEIALTAIAAAIVYIHFVGRRGGVEPAVEPAAQPASA